MKLNIKGVEHHLDIDPSKLTFGDVVEIEEISAIPFGEFSKQLETGSFKALQTVLTVLAKRTDPTVTVADIAALPLSDLSAARAAVAAKPAAKKAERSKPAA